MAGALRRAALAATAVTAGLRVIAAVTPGQALELPPDGDRALVEVNVLPPQAERFSLAQPKGQGHAPAGAVAAVGGERDDLLGFFQGQRLDFGLARRRWVNERGNVPGGVAALSGAPVSS